jgi:5'-3' exonuclease
MAQPTLVLDSASLYYRSYYALPSSMTAPDGRPHQALRGFLTTLARLIEQHRPAGIVAAWDADWRPQWRVDLLPGYKAHRVAEPEAGAGSGAEAEPEDLGPQAEALADLLDALAIARWGLAGYEADDVIGSVTRQLPGPLIVVSGDRDLVQLIDDRTLLHLTVNGGMPGWPILDPASAQERFGVSPRHYVDLAVLRGDPSDGLPGVPGIGAKTAAALVNAFGGCDGIVEAARRGIAERPLTARLAGLLLDNEDYLERAVQVASVVRDLALPDQPTTLPSAESPQAQAIAAEWGVERQLRELMSAVETAAGA